MRPVVQIAVALICSLGSSATSAGDFDGSKPLICAPVEVRDCAVGEGCIRALPQEIGAPAFVRIDFKNNSIAGPKRTTKILFTEKTAGQILLQGTELGHGWTIVLDQDTGALTAALVDVDGAFVLFGSCTPL